MLLKQNDALVSTTSVDALANIDFTLAAGGEFSVMNNVKTVIGAERVSSASGVTHAVQVQASMAGSGLCAYRRLDGFVRAVSADGRLLSIACRQPSCVSSQLNVLCDVYDCDMAVHDGLGALRTGDNVLVDVRLAVLCPVSVNARTILTCLQAASAGRLAIASNVTLQQRSRIDTGANNDANKQLRQLYATAFGSSKNAQRNGNNQQQRRHVACAFDSSKSELESNISPFSESDDEKELQQLLADVDQHRFEQSSPISTYTPLQPVDDCTLSDGAITDRAESTNSGAVDNKTPSPAPTCHDNPSTLPDRLALSSNNSLRPFAQPSANTGFVVPSVVCYNCKRAHHAAACPLPHRCSRCGTMAHATGQMARGAGCSATLVHQCIVCGTQSSATRDCHQPPMCLYCATVYPNEAQFMPHYTHDTVRMCQRLAKDHGVHAETHLHRLLYTATTYISATPMPYVARDVQCEYSAAGTFICSSIICRWRLSLRAAAGAWRTARARLSTCARWQSKCVTASMNALIRICMCFAFRIFSFDFFSVRAMFLFMNTFLSETR
jgi:hypothetical protein